MATIVNTRDLILQGTSPRIAVPTIPISRVEGLPAALKGVRINASATTFTGKTGTTSPATITLTVERLNGVTGTAVWTLLSGTATLTPSGDTCTVTGSTMTTDSITVRARVIDGSTNYDTQIIITKLGATSLFDKINLATQVTNKLANTNVDGLGALALLGSVDLGTTQVVGSLAANRIGVGTLAAGVIYAGNINVTQLVGEIIIGKSVAGGNYLLLGSSSTATSPAYFFLNTDGVPANGAIGLVKGSFTAQSLNLQNSLIVDASSTRMVVGTSGTISLLAPRSGGGNHTITVSQSGGISMNGDIALTGNDISLTGGNINFSGSFGGTLGSRIILKNVLYNVEVNGTPGTTVKFV